MVLKKDIVQANKNRDYYEDLYQQTNLKDLDITVGEKYRITFKIKKAKNPS